MGLRQIKKNCDTWFSRAVRQNFIREDGTILCVGCGRVIQAKGSHCSHFFTKALNKYIALRWYEKNACIMCYDCNTNREGQSGPFALFLSRRYGPDIFEELNNIAEQRSEICQAEIIQMTDYFKNLAFSRGFHYNG